MDENKTVCDCFGITVGDLKAVVDGGATSFEAVQEETSVATCCGKCLEEAQTVVAELLKK